MSLIDDLLTYAVAQGLGVKGTDLFGGLTPDRPDVLLVILEDAGEEAVYTMGSQPGQAKLKVPHAQIVARAKSSDYVACKAKAEAAYAKFDGLRNTVIAGTTYHFIQALQEPFVIGHDLNDRIEIGFNIRIQRST